MDMIERVARAIYEADDPWSEAFPWPGLAEPKRPDNYRRIARAAIEAMMEPTEEMVAAGRPVDRMALRSVDSIYNAMIRAALEESK